MKNSDLKKLFGVKTQAELNRELKTIISAIQPLGLVLRFIPSEDKWYLLAKSQHPPPDLTKTLIETLLTAFQLETTHSQVTSSIIAAQRGLDEGTVDKHLNELDNLNYIEKNSQGLVKMTLKTKKLFKI